VKPIRFTRGSRKHRIGRGSARYVIDTFAATTGTDPVTGDTTLSWVGDDERGRELEVVAIDKPDCCLVIHVMPTHLRRRNP
jgi:hypothetical protein